MILLIYDLPSRKFNRYPSKLGSSFSMDQVVKPEVEIESLAFWQIFKIIGQFQVSSCSKVGFIIRRMSKCKYPHPNPICYRKIRVLPRPYFLGYSLDIKNISINSHLDYDPLCVFFYTGYK